MKLSDLVSTGGLLLVHSRLILSSVTIYVPSDGMAVVAGMGGGAGGCRARAPGNSAPWGVRAFAVKAGDNIVFAIGAGGAPVGVAPANAGGLTSIYHNGVPLMTCQGGDAGLNSTTDRAPVVAQVTGADYWMWGRQPQQSPGANAYCGAAVDLGCGTYSPAVNVGDCAVDLTHGQMGVGAIRGFSFWPFDIQINTTDWGSPGVGASGDVAPPGGNSGLFGGGNGAVAASYICAPGRGASAGSVNSTGMAPLYGGAGLGHLRLFKKV
ncbi:hypothetical protein [Delftia sp. 67-8]|uniref:hypothetical protein n=1 Tax=Delftia sp. 67-8 TaxID=1895749 RepID=UPI00092A0C7F|nr:hypothetical protein [Delftia sp. 67-8]OJX10268.1 MAG: hypothetical protein BGO79_15250 [Delftia sp. 67-8]